MCGVLRALQRTQTTLTCGGNAASRLLTDGSTGVTDARRSPAASSTAAYGMCTVSSQRRSARTVCSHLFVLIKFIGTLCLPMDASLAPCTQMGLPFTATTAAQDEEAGECP